jgi:hypothetical protein
VTPGATPIGVDEVVVLFSRGKGLNPGRYLLQIPASGITDIAGNPLNGQFTGSYPSGNMGAGGNFVARFTAYRKKTLAAFPIQTGDAQPRPMVSMPHSARVAAASHSHAVTAARAMRATNQPVPSPASHIDEAIASLAGLKPWRRAR